MREVYKYMAAKLSKVALITGLISGLMAPVAVLAVGNPGPPYCQFNTDPKASIHVSGESASAKFTIPQGCAKNLKYSLAVYTICNASLKPFSQQKLHSAKTFVLDPGRHSIGNVHVPSNIYWQIDLIKGVPTDQLSDSGTYAPASRLITATSGGSACPSPQTPPQQTPPSSTPPADNGANSNANANANANNASSNNSSTNITNNNVNNNSNSQSQTVNVGVSAQTPPSGSTGSSSSSASSSAGVGSGVSGTAESSAVSGGESVAVSESVEVSGKTPDVLPNTGVGNMMATFLGVSSIASLAFHLALRRFSSQAD